jgi:soluble lytic murein transglycosylase
MILRLFRSISLAFSVGIFAIPAASAANQADEILLAAFDAYRAGDAIRFSKHARKLERHVLAPWVEYWRISFGLEDASPGEVGAFFAQHGTTYPAERLRADWLKVLGRRGAWQEFEIQSAALAREDLEIRCYRLSARLAKGEKSGDEDAVREAAPIWLEPRELPEGCTRLADTLAERGALSVTDVWQRVRVLFENGAITAAKNALAYLPKSESPDERALAEAARTPKRLIDRLPKSIEHRAAREVAVLAGARLAKLDVKAAAAALEGTLSERLPERELKYLWGRVAYEAARQHHDQALKWYARAGDTRLDDEQLAWKARAALRRGAWVSVREAVDRMSASTRQDPAWTYWYGRALAAQGEETGARAYYLRIAGQTDFYGLLANEELGYVATLPEASYVPREEEIAAAAREPGLARALELIRLGLRSEGVREWLFTLRGFDDPKLLAASEFARRAGVYDRAIQAADRTERQHNFALRYPVPFRSVFQEYARAHQLDEAWVLGLVRQESRFVVEARSSAGAAGLMQLMPATAKYVASKIGLRNYQPSRVTEVQTNVTLGTGYLRMVLDQLGHQVLASAAYNAGPGRARRWRDARPLEGAIYAETIPFNETRDYVKKVTANSVFYAALLEKRITPLKERLGTIPARNGSEPVDEDLP